MRVTKHAMERIEERKITTEELVNCVQYGHRMANRNDPENRTTVVYNGERKIYIVMDKAETTVITAFTQERMN